MTKVSAAEIILIADPKILAVAVQENHEGLVDLRLQQDIVYGPSPEVANNQDYTYLRATVYEKLKLAQSMLPSGIHFCLYEGYRSLKLQKQLFDTRYAKIAAAHPNWSTAELFNETIKMVSPTINFDGSFNVPPHATGGALDVYLLDAAGKPLDMGIHPKDWLSDETGVLSLTASQFISPEAQKNRALMAKVLTALGFVNYPTEYWHWSYGDKYWAYMQQQPAALYDIAEIS
jgi:zinc D-Ala-D-Ala dipeptidase